MKLSEALQTPHLSALLSKAEAVVSYGNGPTLKIHAGLAAGALGLGHTLGYGLWCYARALDTTGAGRVTLQALRENSTPFFSKDRMKRALADAKAAGLIRVVTRHKDRCQIVELVSLEHAAVALAVATLGAFPVLVPAGKLARAAVWKSALWAAWHAGRSSCPRPISRKVQNKLTGLSDRTARRYEARAGVVKRRTYERRTIGKAKHAGRDAMAEEHLQGVGAFEVKDKTTGKFFLFVCKPNVYTLPNAPLARRGMSRKVNSVLRAGLLTNAGGHQKSRRLRLFFDTPMAARKALKLYERRRDLDEADIPRAVFGYECDTQTGAALWRKVERL